MEVICEIKQYLPIPYKKKRYYTKTEVSLHNHADNCWIILFGYVYDLTSLIQNDIENIQNKPLIQAAGTDITYLFDNKTRQPKTKIDLEKAEKTFYCPYGKYLHLNNNMEIKWWKNQIFIIGKLTKKSRKIRIVNTLTDKEFILEVPSQENVKEILTRYLEYNSHAGSYIWKRLNRPVDMSKTLEQNGIKDEDEQFQRLGIPQNQWYIPTIHLYFNDDLTVA